MDFYDFIGLGLMFLILIFPILRKTIEDRLKKGQSHEVSGQAQKGPKKKEKQLLEEFFNSLNIDLDEEEHRSRQSARPHVPPPPPSVVPLHRRAQATARPVHEPSTGITTAASPGPSS